MASESKKECAKCRYSGITYEKNGLYFCDVCLTFCPTDPELTDKYAEELVDHKHLEAFRKFSRTRGQQQISGMIKKASKGKAVSRAPFGYTFQKGHLVPAQNSDEVMEIFEEFLEDKMSLTKLAKKHNLSVNGLKKVLKNFTYIGKVKFNNQVYEGTHKPLVDAILFNKVQDKLEKISKKAKSKKK